jgi:hypothetical protein
MRRGLLRKRGRRRPRSSSSQIVYLVSGHVDIKPSHVNIRRSGRRVKYDLEVSPDAAAELRSGRTFVVVSHGRPNGTVTWYRSDRGSAQRWLWVGMDSPPKGARLYLYACMAGRRLPRWLRRCEALGHFDEVPMPVNGARAVVMRYFDEVDRVIDDRSLEPSDWRVELVRHLDEAHAAEVANPTGYLCSAALLMLRRSWGFGNV